MKFCLLTLVILLTLLTAPAFADLTLGFVPAVGAPLRNRAQAEKLTRYLNSRLPTQVNLRTFQDETFLQRRLSLDRDIDIALVSRDFYEQAQNGSYLHLADYLPTAESAARSVDTLIARRGLSAGNLQGLRDILLVMDSDPSGSQILAELSVEQFASPLEHVSPPVQTAKPVSTSPKPVVSHAANPSIKPQASVKPVPADSVEAVNTSEPERPAAATPKPLAAMLPGAPQVASSPASRTPATTVLAPSVASTQLVVKPVVDPPEPPVAAPKTAPDKAVDGGPQKDQPGSLPLWPIAVLVLLGGLIFKGLLLVRRRPRKRPHLAASTTLIQHDWSELYASPQRGAETATVAQPPPPPSTQPAISIQEKLKPLPPTADHSANGDGSRTNNSPGHAPRHNALDLNLGGVLTSAQIPAMLQFIAASGHDGKLLVRSESNEKIISFMNGVIVAATSVNLANKHQSGFLMNKLGYLLIRQGKISEDDRDQAMVLCENDPSLRLGEALIKLGRLDGLALKSSLRDQAKMILHSMIVFPEGEFKFIQEKLNLPQRDNLGMNVKEFLREAVNHQNEWRNIRQLIPSLDTVLGFTPGGKEKSNSGTMTIHQKFVLSLIDGVRPIREISQEATMLDYEVYRFLYLMTKANILERVAGPASKAVHPT
ncbi:MAG TPA: DUF4388 domain-containing protein [Geothermobacteraceae bacterium]|nr:DUF4388 domain-containing protein [Geothermobacteraceae bacterium]